MIVHTIYKQDAKLHFPESFCACLEDFSVRGTGLFLPPIVYICPAFDGQTCYAVKYTVNRLSLIVTAA
ncbi:hypothetical protein Barb7_01433 [Bacteroidales bacterium Barb7]|nr:hypothetical protein Barb7_01433 [Bacteroidales bacterium Barb7]